jgi:hypothetical protein
MMTLTADAHGLRGREFRFWCDPPARFCESSAVLKLIDIFYQYPTAPM